MKPIKLEIEGLHSFEKNQIIDFRLLSTHGIFGIFGATGSGKSTILDAIVLALYGKVQRSKTNSDFINLKSNKAVVAFEFSFFEDGKEKYYLVKRSFKRKNKKPQEVDQVAEVFEVGALGSKQIVEGANKVDNFIINLLGMSDTEFLKCIALPQGEFASFLRAKPNERVSIIGNIFDLNKYGQALWEKVRDKTENLEKELAVVDGKIAVVGELDKSQIEASRKKLTSIIKETEKKKSKLEEISKIEKEESEIARLGQELEDTNKMLQSYYDMAENISVKKETLKKAVKLSENEFLFKRTEELSRLVVDEEDEIYRLEESLKSERARSDEFYCESTLELEDIRQRTEKSVAKLEKLKSLILVEDKVRDLKNQKTAYSQDLQIAKNKSESIQKKIKEKNISKGIKSSSLKEIDNELELLKEQLKGFENVLTYNSILGFSKELSTYKDFIEVKHSEAVQAMTLAIDNQNKLDVQKKAIEEELKNLYKNFGLKGSIGTSKIKSIIKESYEDLVKFSKVKGIVETLIAQRVDVATEICGEKNKHDRLEAEKIRLDEKFKAMDDDITALKKKIKEVQDKKCKSLSENGIADIVGRIKIGDSCPICCSEVLRKSVPNTIDIMVIDNEIEELGNVLSRKEEAKENIVYSIAKTVTKLENCVESLTILESRQLELKKKIESVFEFDFKSTVIDEEEELKRLEKVLNDKLDLLVKSEKKEQLLLGKLQDIQERIVKQNCVSVAARMEVNNWSELLENVANSIKNKDIQLLGLVSQNENPAEKLAKLEELNAKLDIKLKEKEKIMQDQTTIDGEIAKLEAELAVSRDEEMDLEELISKLELNISSEKIAIDAETVDGDVHKTIELEQAEYDSYKHRESELLSLQNDRKNGVSAYASELNILRTKYNTHKDEHKRLVDVVLKVLKELGFSSIQESKLFMMGENEISALREDVDKYERELVVAKSKKIELEKTLNGKVSSSAILEQMLIQMECLTKEIKENEEEIIKLKCEIDAIEEKAKVLSQLTIIKENLDKEYSLSKELYDCLKGKALMEFIAEEFIDDISFMASSKLQVLMDGRYVLTYQNKEFFVIDNFNDASIRPVSTLSGGEMFVVSLALALSISDAIATKANKNIDFFFLDEGFGTLDKEYCEYIVDSLIKLESQNLTIGLISHMPELQERISQKLQVEKTANGSIVKCVTDI